MPQALNTITRSAGLYSALVPSDSSHNALKRRQDYRQGCKPLQWMTGLKRKGDRMLFHPFLVVGTTATDTGVPAWASVPLGRAPLRFTTSLWSFLAFGLTCETRNYKHETFLITFSFFCFSFCIPTVVAPAMTNFSESYGLLFVKHRVLRQNS